MSREYIIAGDGEPIYINETGTRQEILATVYVNETVVISGGSFQPAWAMQSNQIIQGGQI